MRNYSMRLGKKNTAWIVAAMVAIGVFVWGPGSSINSAGSPAVSTTAATQLASPGVNLAQSPNDPHKVMGVQRADCKKCHPSEVAAWMKQSHFFSREKLMNVTGNTKKYIEALNIAPETILTTSMCADCHATKAEVNGQLKAISGVSCESCHGASGGEGGWLNRHQSYNPDMPVTRQQETPAHREQRLADCDRAGMVRPENLGKLLNRCLSCHVITNETLVAAGHKANSNFDFGSWTTGEIRHNFFVDRNHNADAPSLWMERTSGSKAENIANRKRLKHVVFALTVLESTLRKRSELTDTQAINTLSQAFGIDSGNISEINGAAATPETTEAAALLIPMLGTFFGPLPDDKETYSQAADKVSELTSRFLKNHDGSQLQGLDSLMKRPPYYSQQFKDRHPDLVK